MSSIAPTISSRISHTLARWTLESGWRMPRRGTASSTYSASLTMLAKRKSSTSVASSPLDMKPVVFQRLASVSTAA